ncbi:HAD family hydrolase [Flavobacterium sp. MFBS3-15]|uniref:HAD family hydrolase n=1 Tax=Flavobacterium sp. MFBS3-15 TaxID=2989816 RepID=UPI0022356B69|nr:HAD family hydrolase [Flavobacterium sp. MFBS3-15]MCW4467889.1 HAD family hydrolase [Flavobacterium sp. MFBS3-15]
MKKLKAVIFDLDGTIANTLPLCITSFRQSIEPLAGRAVSDAEIIATFGPSEEGTIMALAPNHFDKGVSEYLHIYEESHDMCPAPFEGMPELIASLKDKDIRVAMVTGKGRASAVITLDKFGMSHLFEILEAGNPDGNRKAEGIESILEAWSDVDKDEVVYVGDTTSDILTCRQVGIPIVSAAWAETAEPNALVAMHPDYIFYTVPEFADWMKRQV